MKLEINDKANAIGEDVLIEYLRFLNFQGDVIPSFITLKQLHQLHPQKITFEGINPLLKLPVSLDLEDVIDKLIRKGRGGYCFEQNTLFYHVLKLIGFNVKCLSARSLWNKPEGAKAQKTHMLLHVDVDSEGYIVDVGFGGLTLTGPLRLVLDKDQETPHETFRIINLRNEFVLQAQIKNEWKPVYSFDLQEQRLYDYEVPNWHVSTHPESRFTSTLIAAKPEPGRRYSLKGNEFTIHITNGHSEKRIIKDVFELKIILTDVFKINLNELSAIDEKLSEIVANC